MHAISYYYYGVTGCGMYQLMLFFKAFKSVKASRTIELGHVNIQIASVFIDKDRNVIFEIENSEVNC